MKRLMTIIVLFTMMIFMATPVFAGPFATALEWIGDITGATDAVVNWSLLSLTVFATGWMLKKYNVEQWGLAWHKGGWKVGRWISAYAKGIPIIGGIWDKGLEPFIIKTATVVPHLVLQLFNGIVAGLLSDNKKPNETK